jgi:hypothetical protein
MNGYYNDQLRVLMREFVEAPDKGSFMARCGFKRAGDRGHDLGAGGRSAGLPQQLRIRHHQPRVGPGGGQIPGSASPQFRLSTYEFDYLVAIENDNVDGTVTGAWLLSTETSQRLGPSKTRRHCLRQIAAAADVIDINAHLAAA